MDSLVFGSGLALAAILGLTAPTLWHSYQEQRLCIEAETDWKHAARVAVWSLDLPDDQVAVRDRALRVLTKSRLSYENACHLRPAIVHGDAP